MELSESNMSSLKGYTVFNIYYMLHVIHKHKVPVL